MRTLFHHDAGYRHAMRWYTRMGRRVWFHEVFEFLFRTQLEKRGPSLADFSGPDLAAHEYSMASVGKRSATAAAPRIEAELVD